MMNTGQMAVRDFRSETLAAIDAVAAVRMLTQREIEAHEIASGRP